MAHTLPETGRPQTVYLDTPLAATEVDNGHVRVRYRSEAPRAATHAQLLLTSTSEAEMRILDIRVGTDAAGLTADPPSASAPCFHVARRR